MERPVEIAVFDRGELQSVRVLSLRRERWAAALAASTGGAVVFATMGAVAALILAFDRVVDTPTFLAVWLAAAAGVGGGFASWARRRLGRYHLGADIEADAFAMAEIDLVRRNGDDYEIGLCPGMTGAFEHRHSAMPLEALVRTSPVYIPLPPSGRVRVEVGTSTFVISRKSAVSGKPFSLREWLRWLGSGPLRRLLRGTALGTPMAIILTMASAMPAAYALHDGGDLRPSVGPDTDGVELARRLRSIAQIQTLSLHRCFDPLPLACQRPGQVAVGVQISPQGSVTSHWTARSSYGEDCPVTSCMESVVASWSFEPMPHTLTLVLPIQVTRTSRGRAGQGPAAAVAEAFVVPPSGLAAWGDPAAGVLMDVSDAGVGCRDSQ